MALVVEVKVKEVSGELLSFSDGTNKENLRTGRCYPEPNSHSTDLGSFYKRTKKRVCFPHRIAHSCQRSGWAINSDCSG